MEHDALNRRRIHVANEWDFRLSRLGLTCVTDTYFPLAKCFFLSSFILAAHTGWLNQLFEFGLSYSEWVFGSCLMLQKIHWCCIKLGNLDAIYVNLVSLLTINWSLVHATCFSVLLA